MTKFAFIFYKNLVVRRTPWMCWPSLVLCEF